MKVRLVLIAIIMAFLTASLTGCVGGGANQNIVANSNSKNDNGPVSPLTVNAPKPNVDSLDMLVYSALSNLKENRWDEAVDLLETAREKATQSKNDPNSGPARPEFENLERMIKDTTTAVRNRDNNAAAMVEQLRKTVLAMKMRVQ